MARDVVSGKGICLCGGDQVIGRGHRLCLQYDIMTIKWLLARQTERLLISRAIDKHINGQGNPIKAWLVGYG